MKSFHAGSARQSRSELSEVKARQFLQRLRSLRRVLTSQRRRPTPNRGGRS